MFTPYLRYSQTKTPDTAGTGSTVVLGDVTTIMGAVKYDEANTIMIASVYCAVSVTDVITIDGENYKVKHIKKQDGGSFNKELILEKVNLPV